MFVSDESVVPLPVLVHTAILDRSNLDSNGMNDIINGFMNSSIVMGSSLVRFQ